MSRDSFEPMTDMVGGGPFHLPAGRWTDDTSMALCLAESLISCGGFDPRDQMERYCRWMDDGHLSSTGRCFDIGNTTRTALVAFQASDDPFSGPTHVRSAGNGCIMRLAPIPMRFTPDLDAVAHYSAESSRTTHGAAECLDASRLFGRMIARALGGATREEALLGDALWDGLEGMSEGLRAIARGDYMRKSVAEVRGTGYVVASLEAALWAFDQSADYAEAVLTAANLGDDADTTAAICGQIAGAHFGLPGIPSAWRERVHMSERIQQMSDALLAANGSTVT